ncbi:hypothetical protein VTK73DRAFT_9328 [Phialemonium thermophilum]|uniref:Uncharacterized protein n=1 Tax=Phialemonium thermophilum TaxID=223376 RepID=A0ABR3W336_9PEZI
MRAHIVGFVIRSKSRILQGTTSARVLEGERGPSAVDARMLCSRTRDATTALHFCRFTRASMQDGSPLPSRSPHTRPATPLPGFKCLTQAMSTRTTGASASTPLELTRSPCFFPPRQSGGHPRACRLLRVSNSPALVFLDALGRLGPRDHLLSPALRASQRRASRQVHLFAGGLGCCRCGGSPERLRRGDELGAEGEVG